MHKKCPKGDEHFKGCYNFIFCILQSFKIINLGQVGCLLYTIEIVNIAVNDFDAKNHSMEFEVTKFVLSGTQCKCLNKSYCCDYP